MKRAIARALPLFECPHRQIAIRRPERRSVHAIGDEVGDPSASVARLQHEERTLREGDARQDEHEQRDGDSERNISVP